MDELCGRLLGVADADGDGAVATGDVVTVGNRCW